MKEFLLPIIACIVGMISLFIDSKDKNKKGIFIFFLILTATVTIIINYKESNEKKNSITESKKSEKELRKILLNITDNTSKIPDLVNLLRGFGFTETNAKNATSEKISNVINANNAITKLVSKIDTVSSSNIVINYYVKDADGEKISKALNEAGFNVNLKESVNNIKTNSIWVGDLITKDQAIYVALALYRAGIDLIQIRRFDNGSGNKSNLIQIGGEPAIKDKRPLSIEQISDMNF